MIIAIIPAKEQSTRLKNKNLLKIQGKTLLEHAINYVRKSKYIDYLVISTESKKIKAFLKKLKIPFINRPKKLCGEAPLIDVYKHAYENLSFKSKIKVIAGVQCDHPDRNLSLDKVIYIFKKKNLDFLYSKNKSKEKNGAHYIFKKEFFNKKKKFKESFIIDNCTNIHFRKDLIKAKKNLIINEN